MFKYLKYYFEPSSKEVHNKAYSAALSFYKDKPFSSYDVRTREFTSFQRGFINSFRHNYAKAKLVKKNLA